MRSRPRSQLQVLAFGALLGLVGGLGATIVALLVVGAGHGNNTPACFLIPWTMIYTLRGASEWWFLPMAAAPYVLYGLAVGYRRWLFVPVLVVHIIFSASALHHYGASFWSV
jgi:hypothetical protein